MQRTLSKKLIAHSLKRIGENGFDGIKINAGSATDAIMSLLPHDVQPLYGRLPVELKRQELVTAEKIGEELFHLTLTVKGIHRLQRLEIEYLTYKKPDLWDGYWRMVLFDIPSEYKSERYLLTRQLKRLGFVMAKQSMWLCPYNCFNAVEQVVQYCNLQRYVTFGEISKLDTHTTRKLLRDFPEIS